MSSSATSPSGKKSEKPNSVASPKDKGKSKAKAEDVMEEEEEEEDEDEDDEVDGDEEEEDEEEEDSLEEIDPSAILPTGRRTRGVKVDYTSKEALAKAGLPDDEADSDEDVEMKD